MSTSPFMRGFETRQIRYGGLVNEYIAPGRVPSGELAESLDPEYFADSHMWHEQF
jgi:hypothetical protein